MNADITAAYGWLELTRQDSEAADGHFRDAMREHTQVEVGTERHHRVIAESLFGLAGSACLRGDYIHAARLAGAAQSAMSRTKENQLFALEHLVQEHQLATARKQLGDAAFSRHFSEGAALTSEEAIEYALASDRLQKQLTRRARDQAR